MEDRQQKGWALESRLERKYGVGIRIHTDEPSGYCCDVSQWMADQCISNLKREVAEYSAKKCGLCYGFFDMSHPGEPPFSEKVHVWCKYEKFESLEGIEEWIKNFADCDIKKVECVYNETLELVTKKLVERATREPPPKSFMENLLE